MLSKTNLEILVKIIYAVETGGQVYGNCRYDDFTEAYANSSNETAITIGAGQWFAGEAKTLLQKIKEKDPDTFKKLDSKGEIAADLKSADWSKYQLKKSSAKAKTIVKIISSAAGKEVQDSLVREQMEKYVTEAEKLGVTDQAALMMCANFRHQGGLSAVKRVLGKTEKPYTLDHIYSACCTDTGNQVGAYKSRQKFVYTTLKSKVNSNVKEETKMGVTAQQIIDIMDSWVGLSRAKGTHKPIIDLYASGEGLRAISNTLYDMGYRNRSGNEIDPTTISRMLSSEKYKGVYVINQRHYDFDTKKTVLNPKSEWVHIPGAVPAIVEPELWDRVQEIKGSKVQSIKNEKRGRNCGKSIFSGKIYCAKCGAKYWRSLENGYVKFKCSSYSKYGKIPGKGCDNKSFSENALYSILQSLSEQIVEVNTAEVRKSLLNWLESLRERLRASQGDDTIKEEIRKQTARKEKLTDAYMDGIISKEDYSKRYKELEKTLEDLKDKLLTLEVNEDLQSIEEVIQNIDKEMEEYLQTQSFNESRVEFLNQHLTKVTVNKDYFLLEFDLIGGAILTGKDFYLFVDNPRATSQSPCLHETLATAAIT